MLPHDLHKHGCQLKYQQDRVRRCRTPPPSSSALEFSFPLRQTPPPLLHNQGLEIPGLVLQLAAASEKSGKALAKELMMPQGIDLSSLGDLAAVLGVSQGLNLLVNNQQGPNPPPFSPVP